MYKYSSIKQYLDDLAAKLSAPGGGSAAALNAAMGVSLISMVVNFTLGKARYAKYEKELKKTLQKSERLRDTLLNLVDSDVVAYKSKNVRDALDVPLMVCRLCFEGIKLTPQLIKKANINLISDVGIAAVFLESAFTCAYLNVEINLRSLRDKKLTENVRKELTGKQNLIRRVRLNTEAKVGEIIRG